MVRASRRASWWRGGLAGLLSLVTLAACASPPEALDRAANALPGQIQQVRKDLDSAKADYNKLLDTTEYSFMKGYSATDRHADRFDQAKAKIDAADAKYNNEVKKITGDYEDSKQASLQKAVDETNVQIGDAKKLMAEPKAWAEKVRNTKDNSDSVQRTASVQAQGLKADYDKLNKDVDRAKTTYANNAAAIGTAFSSLTTLQATALTASGLLAAEAKNSPPNFAVMTDKAVTIEEASKTYTKDAGVFRSKLAQLDGRETRTLVDIRVDSEVEVGRTSWDESSDSHTDKDHDYASVLVDLDTANYFAQFKPDQVVAKWNPGFVGNGEFQLEKPMDKAQWDKLKIDPKAAWPGSHSAAEYFVEVSDTYCHKLRVLKDGKLDASGRPKPTENYCSKYDTDADLAAGMYWVESDTLDAEAIGMDVYGKGIGDFVDQATTAPMPPGMVYVGDPTAGEWQTDSSGANFWMYYGIYRMFGDLIGGPYPYHYRSEYDDWHRKHRYHSTPYWGTFNGQPRYGVKSPLLATRFPNSNFATSGLQSATLRNAGPAARGGGPGGGGK